MPNIAQVLKSEIARIARKEVRAEVVALKRAVAAQRTLLAVLKRRNAELEREMRQSGRRGGRKAAAQPLGNDGAAELQRFSAKGLAAHRRRLGLSAADCGLLLGTSAQTVRNWEEGKVRPRARHLPGIAALRTLGKRQATSHLERLRGTAAAG
jgi:DNA-binding transcriptional regulator YiaG